MSVLDRSFSESAKRLIAELETEMPRLDLVALAIASLDDQPFDEAMILGTLDTWAARVAEVGHGSLRTGIEALEEVLAGEVGLRGEKEDYDAPENSFLPRVLERKRGLPIALSVVYIEVARRAQIPLFGVGLPGHFVVGYAPSPGSVILLDPFAGARMLRRNEAEAIAEQGGKRLSRQLLQPASARSIALRMLHNLTNSYKRRENLEKVRATLDLWLAIDPEDATALAAYADLERPQLPRKPGTFSLN
jgi:regulator of sirC expression with transglutaminase-like and TPR domain